MSFVGSMLGQNGTGANWRAQNAPIVNPVTGAQTTQAYNDAQTGLQQQQAFLQALQAQNGIGNQSDVYNNLKNIAAGNGPNPAQNALNQATSANVANQAALMAGQRGAGANVGLMARQAAQQGAATQQQAAGQGATMQAQQQMNAINQMGGISGQQVQNQANAVQGYGTMAQNEQQNLLNAVSQYNNAAVGNASSQNSSNAGIANTIAGGQMKMMSGLINSAGSAAMAATGGEVKKDSVGQNPVMLADGAAPVMGAPNLGVNYDLPGPRSFVGRSLRSNTPSNTAPAAPIAQAAPNPLALDQKDSEVQAGQTIGKGAIAAGKAIGGLFSSKEPSAADAIKDPDMGSQFANAVPAPSLGVDTSMPTAPEMPMFDDGGMVEQITKAAPMIAMMLSKGGKVPALVSPGEMYLPPDKVAKVAKAKDKGDEIKKEAEKIPGKAKVKGDSLKNDTVPKTLEEGGIVIPRSIALADDMPKKAAAFIAAHLAKNGLGMPAPKKKAK